jgi:hypothetical protein
MSLNFEFMKSVLAILGGATVIVTSIVGFSYWLFKTFSSKWLDHRFAKELENLRHDHEKQLQDTQVKMDAKLDRAIKFHTKEFDALSEAWSLLDDAFAAAEQLSNRVFQNSDIGSLPPPQQAELMKAREFTELECESVKRAPDKTAEYLRVLQIRDWADAHAKQRQLYEFVLKNGIFFPTEIKDKFLALHLIIFDATTEKKAFLDKDGGPVGTKCADVLRGGGREKLEDLQNKVHARLVVH